MRRRRLVTGIVLLIVVVCVVVGVVWVRSMLSPQRFTDMLREQVDAAGLRMQLDGPAEPTIWPHLAVRLNGLNLRRVGHDAPMLAAREVFLVVPWGSLLHGEVRIEKLQIMAPQIDLEQAKAWLGEYQQKNTEASQLALPTIDAGIHLEDGTVVSGHSLLLKSLSIDTGALKSGQAFQLNIQAMDPENRPLALQMETTPEQTGASVQFNPMKLYLSAGAPPSLRLSGQLQWHGGLDFAGALDGTLKLAQGDYSTSLKFLPGSNGDARTPEKSMRVTVDGDGAQMDLVLNPAQAWQWWQQISATDAGTIPLPPVEGTISADKLDVGSLHIEGFRVQVTEPGVTTSIGSPARAASTPGKP